MAVCGCISAVHMNWQSNIVGTRNTGPAPGFRSSNTTNQTISLAFGGSESMGLSLRLSYTHSFKSRLRKNGFPLQVSVHQQVLFNLLFIELSN